MSKAMQVISSILSGSYHKVGLSFHYRFAEIKEGGYLTDHVQQPILVNYPDDWPDDVTFQQLINNWANVWASTSWTTRKWSSVM